MFSIAELGWTFEAICILTIADRFGAKEELEALLARVKTDWPDVTMPAVNALENRGLETLRYLRNRGYADIPERYAFPHGGAPLVVLRMPEHRTSPRATALTIAYGTQVRNTRLRTAVSGTLYDTLSRQHLKC